MVTEFTVFYALMSIGTYLVCSVVRVAVLAVHFPLLRRMGYASTFSRAV